MLNPDTNSDSPSEKSNGVRLVSAKQDTTHNITSFSLTAVQNIITHEFGHALGLGHYKITDYPIYTNDRPWLEASVMYYSIDPQVTEVAKPKYVDIKMDEE